MKAGIDDKLVIVTAYDTSRTLLDKNRQENQVLNTTSEVIEKPAAGFETPHR